MTAENIKARILIVEDSMGVSQAFQRAVSMYQDGVYRVEICESGEAALKWLYETPFDLLISDLRLPGIDGLELLERARHIHPGLRTILITAFGTSEVEERARRMANAYLPKPFSLRDLTRMVEKVLAEPAPAVLPTSLGSDQAQDQLQIDRAKISLKSGKYKKKTAHLIVLAFDLDGTLAEDGLVAPETLEMLWIAKMAGMALILVTGRTLDSISTEVFLADLFEAIVAENGAVVYFPRRDSVALPFGRLDHLILDRLKATGVPLGRGIAIVATSVPHDKAILEALRQVHSAVVIEYNRDSLMILPPGATKGSGLLYALQELGYSPHNVVAFGDAENDRSMIEVAELGIAVANSQPALKTAADAVLSLPDGAGIRTILQELLDGRAPSRKQRPDRRLLLGYRLSGAPIHLDPFMLVENNLGIFGSSGSGKSWLAGLLAEELLKQKYQICIIDPEGEYRGLGTSPNTLLLGGPDRLLPPVFDVLEICEWNPVSLVMDLSTYSMKERTDFVAKFLQALRGLRGRRGRPHCVLVDEIQDFCPPGGGRLTDLFLEVMQPGGFGVISYRTSQIAPALLAALDHFLITRLRLKDELDALQPHLERFNGDVAVLNQLQSLPIGQACLYLNPARLPFPSANGSIKFQVGQRSIPHIRHLHKYLRAPLPEPKRFYFQEGDERSLGKSAANLWEFREALGEISLDSLRYHHRRRDFERWLREVLHDEELALRIGEIGSRDLDGETLRQALLLAVISRYEELEALA